MTATTQDPDEESSVCSRVSSVSSVHSLHSARSVSSVHSIRSARSVSSASSASKVSAVGSRVSLDSQLTTDSLHLGTDITSDILSCNSDSVSCISDLPAEEEDADLSSNSDTDYYSLKSEEEDHSQAAGGGGRVFATYSSSDSDDSDDDKAHYQEDNEDSDTLIEAASSSISEAVELFSPAAGMLGKKKKTFSLSTEHLPGMLSTPAVSTEPGEQNVGDRQPSRLSASHPEMYRIELEGELAPAKKEAKSNGLKRSLKKLKRVFRSSPKLSEAAVYKAVEFQNSVNQNPIYIAR